jgi:hypothetical protein
MRAVTPPIIFFQGGSPKQATPFRASDLPHPENSFSQISGDEAWMKV